MKIITEKARHTPVILSTYVLVVGDGPGGLAAALAAARAGVQVCMVERFGCYGGNITVVGVEGLAWYRHEKTVEANGIARVRGPGKSNGRSRSRKPVAEL